MGLDLVEIVLAVEESFQIHIPDEAFHSVNTVGDFHALIVSTLGADDLGRYRTSTAFYRTRRGLVETLGLERRSIRPATAPEPMLPRAGRRRKELWQRPESAMNLRLPPLVCPDWTILIPAGIAAVAALFPSFWNGMRWTTSLWLAPAGFILGLLLLHTGGRRLAVSLPRNLATVGNLSRAVLAINYPQFGAPARSTKKDVWETLCQIIVKQTGVERSRITPDTSIVRDLGID
jgi:acyl carrier protein